MERGDRTNHWSTTTPSSLSHCTPIVVVVMHHYTIDSLFISSFFRLLLLLLLSLLWFSYVYLFLFDLIRQLGSALPPTNTSVQALNTTLSLPPLSLYWHSPPSTLVFGFLLFSFFFFYVCVGGSYLNSFSIDLFNHTRSSASHGTFFFFSFFQSVTNVHDDGWKGGRDMQTRQSWWNTRWWNQSDPSREYTGWHHHVAHHHRGASSIPACATA